mmetsp:Transcript_7239/g.12230  ORF Transcript_7239/g.12230 Transcript_7239/m.12230 type:complete len:606 (+) Transcript_7239:187-2004(+)|eukprot:CAMPEP_0119319132 /NCGR_PEP_ID=MMETSP1333-20130426/48527_1 /TAXON_ID=418940 /ORGANISM="Scyphosphaera apsteinii, Strain RCC1455" /LENGTH=605 /DNA_ID=CAMNT_0007325471 /DNA_START=94 /DNA_END=1911 /DNA_ORIENTATION=-
MAASSSETLLSEASSSKNFPCFPPLNRFNHNVVVTWLLVVVEGIGDNIWTGTVLASYLYELMGKSNAYAGYVEAAQGLSNLIVALPVGWAADRGSKAKIIACGGVLVPLAVAASSFAVIYGTSHIEENILCFWIFLGAMCMWGIVNAVSSGPAQALYADSVQTGERSRYYTILFSLYLLSSMLGPLVSIIMFVLHGNHWRLPDLRNIFLAGLGFELVSMVFFFGYKDGCSLEIASQHTAADAPGSEPVESDDGKLAQPKEAEGTTTSAGATQIWMIPYILFASSLCFALGSGMTVKFFPLFFKNSCHLSPVGVQSIYLAVPVLMAAMSGVGTKISSRFGRAHTMVAVKVVGVSLLVGMAILADHWFGESALHDRDHSAVVTLKAFVVVAIYLLRTGLMNCSYPLEESILMDFVPPSTRARWKALDSIGTFGWCGSAALGGYLADQKGYAFTFFITAGIQGIATLLQAVLVFIVPRSEKPAPNVTSTHDEPTTQPLQATRGHDRHDEPILQPLQANQGHGLMTRAVRVEDSLNGGAASNGDASATDVVTEAIAANRPQVMAVDVPAGAVPGQTVVVILPDGTKLLMKLPRNAVPGGRVDITLPLNP